MLDWIILGVYLLGYVMTWRRATWIVADDMAYFNDPPETDDLVLGVFIGAVIALFWPLVTPGYLLHRRGAAQSGLWAFAKPPKQKRAEIEKKQLERRIRELEREVGLKQL